MLGKASFIGELLHALRLKCLALIPQAVVARMPRSLFIGRFQPFHIGHLEAVKNILSEGGEIIIGVGSAQHSYTLENPFTAGERIEIIVRSLNEAKIPTERCLIVPLTDVGSHSMWVSHIRTLCPPFQIIYSNNVLVRRLFSDTGAEVRPVKEYRRETLSATEIRKRMIAGGDWKSLVTRPAADYIVTIQGDERLREISRKEFSP